MFPEQGTGRSCGFEKIFLLPSFTQTGQWPTSDVAISLITPEHGVACFLNKGVAGCVVLKNHFIAIIPFPQTGQWPNTNPWTTAAFCWSSSTKQITCRQCQRQSASYSTRKTAFKQQQQRRTSHWTRTHFTSQSETIERAIDSKQ